MKRTLIITMEFPPQVGGIATYIEKMLGDFDPSQVLVLAPPLRKGEENFDDKYPFRVIRKKLLYPKFIWPRWIKLLGIVKRIVKEYNIEAIHVHHALPVGYAALRMKQKFNIPFLLFSHGTDIQAASRDARKRKMLTKIGNAAEQIIVNSESLGLRLRNAFPELGKKVTVLYPCPNDNFFRDVSFDEYTKMKNQLSLEGKRVLLSASRLVDGKGFTELIRYIPTITQHYPDVVWLIVGDGEKRDVLLEMIKKYNLHNIVRFMGEVPHEEMPVYYAIADIFVLLTHPFEGKEEGLGLVFLEAAARALPIVAGRSGGVEEAVIHGETGLVVDAFNESEVLEALKMYIEDDEYAKTMGKNAQKRIFSEFLWKHQLEKIQKWL